ncbi:MAG: DMT family transporter [Candidatus Magasanikbacteria bacterium]|nr:DMT family transporter [Candidatus Magasanikbacteria bacterium]
MIITFCTPLISVSLSHIFLREKITRSFVAGFVLLFLGIIISSTNLFQAFFHFSWNDLYFATAALVYAGSDIIYKKTLTNVSHEFILLGRNLFGSIFLLLGIAIFSLEVPIQFAFEPVTFIRLGLIVLIPVLVGQTLWYTAIDHIKIREATIIDSLYPLFSALIAYVVLRENIMPAQVVGGLLMLSGLLVSQLEHPPQLFHTDAEKQQKKHAKLRALKQY